MTVSAYVVTSMTFFLLVGVTCQLSSDSSDEIQRREIQGTAAQQPYAFDGYRRAADDAAATASQTDVEGDIKASASVAAHVRLSRPPSTAQTQTAAVNSRPLRSVGTNQTGGTLADSGVADANIQFPVTFGEPEAYAVTKMKIYSTFSMQMKVRTLQSEAVLAYMGSGGLQERDFLALELDGGRPRYVFDTGNGPRQILAPSASAPINDGQWHHIGVVRSDLTDERGHSLVVDGVTSYDQQQMGLSKTRHAVHFDLNDELFIGGVPRLTHRPAARAALKSRNGFHGCMASLTLNGQIRNIVDVSLFEISEESFGHIKAGCDGPSLECRMPGPICQNEGECVQHWSSYSCLCDMTSFSGPTCADESTAYTFGHHGGGMIVFSFPDHELPDAKLDKLAFGLVTTQRVASLIRVVSGSSSDFVELELVDGNVFVIYNVGLTDHMISDPYVKVNDGVYHVIRFTRNGANATLRIDDWPEQIKIPTGQQLNTFNHQSKIYIGGKPSDASTGASARHFRGTIAGLVFNGIHVLTLAADRDSTVAIRGDVELEVQTLRPPRHTTTASALLPNKRTAPSTKFVTTMTMTKAAVSSSMSFLNCTGSSSCMFNTSAVTTTPSQRFVFRLASIATAVKKLLPNDSVDAAASHSPKGPEDVNNAKNVVSSRCDPENVDDEDCGQSSGDDIDANAAVSRPSLFSSASNSTSGLPAAQPTEINVSSTTANPSAAVRGAASKRSDTEIGATGEGADALADDPSASSTAVGARPGRGTGGSSGQGGGQLFANVGLITGISIGVFVAIGMAGFAVYKYRSRDEGTYRLDPDARNGYAGYRPCTVGAGSSAASSGRCVVGASSTLAVDCLDVDDCGSKTGSGASSVVGGIAGKVYKLRSFRSRPKGRRDTKEWYV